MIITDHAFDRYATRVDALSEADIRKRLDTPIMRAAIAWGATAVKLPGGQRAILKNGAIITIIPAPSKRGKTGKHVRGRRPELEIA